MIIVALDFPNAQEVKKFIPKLENEVSWVKVGMELFYSEGPAIIEYLLAQNYKIFLDLKLHDIPTTVSRALKVVDTMGVSMVNIHALGGVEMLEQAREVVKTAMLIGVTVLTSHDEASLNELNLSGPLDNNVLNLAQVSEKSGLDGIVCSAQDLERLTSKLSPEFKYVTPGIRLNASSDDQKRVMSPSQAMKAGATHLVIGREITRANDIALSLEAIKKDLNG